MKILAIESSGASFSIALSEHNNLVYEVFFNAGLIHSEKILPTIEKALNEVSWSLKDINRIGICTGPGSFTGIRVGLSCARMLSQSLSINLVGVNTLDILSQSLPEGNYYIYPAVDALRGDVYVRDKSKKYVIIKSINEFLDELRDLKSETKIFLIGNAVFKYSKEIKKILKEKVIFGDGQINFPKASTLAFIAQNTKGKSFDKVKPLYIRKSWAEERK